MNDTTRLARWFVATILKRHWTRADWGGTVMAHAKKLLKLGYGLNEIQGCALALVKNPDMFEGWTGEWPLQYMVTILKGEPPYIEQWLRPPDPPPIYEIHRYDDWVMVYGKKAVEMGLWDGIYLPINEPYRLNDKALEIILGDEAIQAALKAKERLAEIGYV